MPEIALNNDEFIRLFETPLEAEDWNSLVVDESAGAVSCFQGTTRNNFQGRNVVQLEYEAYTPMALKKMNTIRMQIYQRWEAIKHVLIWHRIGIVPVKQASVIIAVSSAHRQSSLEAVSWAIDELKKTVPIWKLEIYDDGSEWKENPEFIEQHFPTNESSKFE